MYSALPATCYAPVWATGAVHGFYLEWTKSLWMLLATKPGLVWLPPETFHGHKISPNVFAALGSLQRSSDPLAGLGEEREGKGGKEKERKGDEKRGNEEKGQEGGEVCSVVLGQIKVG